LFGEGRDGYETVPFMRVRLCIALIFALTALGLAGAAPASAQAPQVILFGAPADGLTSTTAVVEAGVLPEGLQTQCQVTYGTGIGPDQAVPCPDNPYTSPANVAVKLTGLFPETAYHFTFRVFNADGSASTDAFTFTTLALAPPANTQKPSVEGDLQLGHVLNADDGVWSGFTPMTFKHQWLRCDADGQSCVPIDGQTGQSHIVTTDDFRHTIAVTVTATNQDGTSSVTTQPTDVILTQPPVNSVLPSITGRANVGMPLRVNSGVWSGDLPINFAYQWLRCDAGGASCAEISGATGSSYTPVLADAGSTIAVREDVANDGGFASAVSRPTAAVLQAPTFGTVFAPIVNATTAGVTGSLNPNGKTTSCRVEYGLTTAYGSSADCPRTFSGTGSVLAQVTLQSLTASTTYHFRMVASNADGATSSGDVTFTTAAPGAPIVTARPATSIGQAAAVANGLVSPNGSAVTSCAVEYGLDTQYGATAPCDQQLGDTGSGIPVTATLSGLSANTTYHYRVVVQNGIGVTDGADVTFTTLAVAAPVDTTLPAITGTASLGLTLSVDDGTWSGGGSQAFARQWLRCDAAGQGCAEIAGATASTYRPVLADAGGTLAVRVTATNEAGSGTAVTAPTPVVLAPPTLAAVTATIVSATTAQITANLNPNGRTTSCRVDYGLTTAYGASVDCPRTFSGTSGVLAQVTLQSLTPSTTYHFRLVASNADGTTVGGDRTLRTAAPA
jgi:hypothetical protein